MTRVRLVDVARSAGVSTATVSFVLSGHRKGRKPASAETEARIRRAAAELGYVPNGHAQAVRRGYSSSIVLALGSPDDPWGAQVANEVAKQARVHALSALMLLDETWYRFLHGFTPGVAFITSTDFEPDGLEKVTALAERGINLVVFSTVAAPDQFDVISSSAVEPTRAAYLQLRSRHERVHLLMVTPTTQAMGPLRVHGYRQGAQHLGDRVDDFIYHAPRAVADAPEACQRLLESKPSAVICATGFLARTLRRVAIGAGIRIPDDLEIIAIGDIPDNESSPLGPISAYGTPEVYSRIAKIVVGRAVAQDNLPYERHVFDWIFTPGSTTIPGPCASPGPLSHLARDR